MFPLILSLLSTFDPLIQMFQFENELILSAVLHTLYESISAVLHKNVEKRALFDHMDSILLIIDEVRK